MHTTSTLKIRTLTPEMIREELASFEHRHGMSSADFWERYCAGQMEEPTEFFRWGALCYMALGECELSRVIGRGSRLGTGRSTDGSPSPMCATPGLSHPG